MVKIVSRNKFKSDGVYKHYIISAKSYIIHTFTESRNNMDGPGSLAGRKRPLFVHLVPRMADVIN